EPEPVRKASLYRRGATWFHLSRPDPLAHYAELRKLLIQHAEHLAKEIDTRAEGAPGDNKDASVTTSMLRLSNGRSPRASPGARLDAHGPNIMQSHTDA